MKLFQTKYFKLLILTILSSSILFNIAKSKETFLLAGDRKSKLEDRIKSIKASYEFKQKLMGNQKKLKIERQKIQREKIIIQDEEKRNERQNEIKESLRKLKEERDYFQTEVENIKESIRELPASRRAKKEEVLESFLSQKEQLLNEQEKIEIKIKETEYLSDSINNFPERLKELKREDKYSKEEIKRINSILKGNKGDVIARGIAGKDNVDMVADIIVGDDVWKGISLGATVRVASSSGDAIGKIVDKYSFSIFGGIVGAIEKGLSSSYRFVFHGSRKPFTVAEIRAWSKLISSDLQEVETMVKNTEKYSAKSREEILRELETDIVDYEEDVLNLWKDFIEDIAYTCEQLAEEIENRKRYYKENKTGFGIHNCSNRLKNKLLKIRNWLISVQSVKDFAALSEVKLVIPAMKKSFKNYFENLENQIKPLDLSKNKSSLGSGSARRNNLWNDDSDGSQPDYFM